MRKIIFKLNNKEYTAEIEKIERKKLYGYSELKAETDKGKECKLAFIDEFTNTIIPKNGLSIGSVDDNMKWIERDELKAVGEDNKPLEIQKSSFESGITLKESVSESDLLTYNIKSIYFINNDLLKAAVKTKIYTFPFIFKEGYFKGYTAFLLNSETDLFMLIGIPAFLQYLKLENAADIEDVDDETETDDEIDFEMM